MDVLPVDVLKLIVLQCDLLSASRLRVACRRVARLDLSDAHVRLFGCAPASAWVGFVAAVRVRDAQRSGTARQSKLPCGRPMFVTPPLHVRQLAPGSTESLVFAGGHATELWANDETYENTDAYIAFLGVDCVRAASATVCISYHYQHGAGFSIFYSAGAMAAMLGDAEAWRSGPCVRCLVESVFSGDYLVDGIVANLTGDGVSGVYSPCGPPVNLDDAKDRSHHNTTKIIKTEAVNRLASLSSSKSKRDTRKPCIVT